MSTSRDKSGPGREADTRPRPAREPRLAKALRDNLRRRKGAAAQGREPPDEGAA